MVLLDAERKGLNERVHELSALNFEKAKEVGSSWLILFYAPWCGHCKKMAPAYERVAEHYHRATPQRVNVGRVDATAHPMLASAYEVQGYPTLVLLRDGKVHRVHMDLVK